MNGTQTKTSSQWGKITTAPSEHKPTNDFLFGLIDNYGDYAISVRMLANEEDAYYALQIRLCNLLSVLHIFKEDNIDNDHF